MVGFGSCNSIVARLEPLKARGHCAVSGAIDRGTPVMDQRGSEIARCFSGLAQELTRNDINSKREAWSLFKSV